MATLAKIGNNTLPPFIKFPGIFGVRLMNQHQDITKGTIVFTEKH